MYLADEPTSAHRVYHTPPYKLKCHIYLYLQKQLKSVERKQGMSHFPPKIVTTTPSAGFEQNYSSTESDREETMTVTT